MVEPSRKNIWPNTQVAEILSPYEYKIREGANLSLKKAPYIKNTTAPKNNRDILVNFSLDINTRADASCSISNLSFDIVTSRAGVKSPDAAANFFAVDRANESTPDSSGGDSYDIARAHSSKPS